MTENGKHWVEARADCTVEKAYCLITSALKQDVERYNALPPNKRRSRNVGCDELIRHQQMVVGFHLHGRVSHEDAVMVERDGICITVFRNDEKMFCVRSKWNTEASKCDYLVDGDPYSIEQISEKAIGDLLFGAP